MRRIVMLIFIYCIASCTYANSENSASNLAPSQERELAHRVLKYTNQYRASKGLTPLRWDQGIAEVCLTHSINMGNRRVRFGHDGFKKRIQLLPAWLAVAENVYMGNKPGDAARDCVNAWIGSRGHEVNLSGDYNACGIGVYKNAQGYWYFTQIFAKYPK